MLVGIVKELLLPDGVRAVLVAGVDVVPEAVSKKILVSAPDCACIFTVVTLTEFA